MDFKRSWIGSTKIVLDMVNKMDWTFEYRLAASEADIYVLVENRSHRLKLPSSVSLPFSSLTAGQPCCLRTAGSALTQTRNTQFLYSLIRLPAVSSLRHYSLDPLQPSCLGTKTSQTQLVDNVTSTVDGVADTLYIRSISLSILPTTCNATIAGKKLTRYMCAILVGCCTVQRVRWGLMRMR